MTKRANCNSAGRIREPLNKSHAGATGCWPGMMARSKAQQIVGDYLQAERQSQRPRSAPPKGVGARMRRLLCRSPRFVVRTTTFVDHLASIRISRQRAPRGAYSEV